MRKVLLAVCLFCGWAVQCAAQVESSQAPESPRGVLKAQLLGISNRFMVDWREHDVAALSRLLAPGFLYVGPQGPVPREGVVNDLAAHCTLTRYSFGDARLLEISTTSAVLIYPIHQDVRCFGQPAAPDVVNTDTFVLRQGVWLLVMTTSTPLLRP